MRLRFWTTVMKSRGRRMNTENAFIYLDPFDSFEFNGDVVQFGLRRP